MLFFFFNDTATTEIYTLSLHDALPISSNATTSHHRWSKSSPISSSPRVTIACAPSESRTTCSAWRSEEHTSELQSLAYLVCRLLLEKKKSGMTLKLQNGMILMSGVR